MHNQLTEIIVPTLAEGHRGPMLMRAIESIRVQGGTALVVVNGNQFAPGVLAQLQCLPDIRLLKVAEPSLSNAILVGRTAVSSKYFGFLDDDDFLLPGSISAREAFLSSNSGVDVVIANGLREEWNEDPCLFNSFAALKAIESDPLAELLKANWMTPCGALYCNDSVPFGVFRNLTKYVEWTDVAFRLIDRFRFSFLMENTFVQCDTPGSLSKHLGQAKYILQLHQKMASKVKTKRHLQLWNERICSLHHQIADDELVANHRSAAWRHHLRSLFHAPMIGVPRYLAHTRKFVLKSGS